VTWSALLAAASREYLKKHEGEHGDKNAAMTAEKNTEDARGTAYACALNEEQEIELFSTTRTAVTYSLVEKFIPLYKFIPLTFIKLEICLKEIFYLIIRKSMYFSLHFKIIYMNLNLKKKIKKLNLKN